MSCLAYDAQMVLAMFAGIGITFGLVAVGLNTHINLTIRLPRARKDDEGKP